MATKTKLKDKTIYPTWDVHVTNGKLLITNRAQFDEHLIPLEGKPNLQMVIRRKVKTRSLKIEKYYHAVPVRLIAEAMQSTDNEAHEFLKNLFLRIEESRILPSGITTRYERTLSTTELGDRQYHDFVFKDVLPWASLPTLDYGLDENSGLELYIPNPNECEWQDRDDWYNL